MKKQAQKNIGFAACTFAISSSGSEVQLFPDGLFRARDGRPFDAPGWVMNEAIARHLIAEAAARNTPYLIDYEHQTLYSEKNGKPAPRAAKFSKMEWRPGDGLYAVDVVWTNQAKEFIDNDEYEFISPVFPYNKETGEVLGFYHAALTNDPAIDGMAGVVAARFNVNFDKPNAEEKPVNDELLKLLGLKEGASDDDISKAVVALKASLNVALGIKKALAVDDDGDLLEAVTALKARVTAGDEPDPAKFVPVGVVSDMQKQIAALSTQVNDREIDELVDVAMSEGKLLPAQETWARDLGKKDVASLKSYIESAQPIAALKRGQTFGGVSGELSDELSDEQLAVCRQMGLSADEYKASLS